MYDDICENPLVMMACAADDIQNCPAHCVENTDRYPGYDMDDIY